MEWLVVPSVPEKSPNKVQPPYSLGASTAEAMEGRGAAKGNAEESTAGRTPGRETALTGLQRVRETATSGASLSECEIRVMTRGKSLVR